MIRRASSPTSDMTLQCPDTAEIIGGAVIYLKSYGLTYKQELWHNHFVIYSTNCEQLLLLGDFPRAGFVG
jgi:hypothetical protein